MVSDPGGEMISPAFSAAISAAFDSVKAGLPDDLSFGEWLANGADLSIFDHSPETHDDAVFSVGYLTGFADRGGQTLLELLEEYGLIEPSDLGEMS